MNRRRKLIAVLTVAFCLLGIMAVGLGIPYHAKTLFQSWTRVESEDAYIELTDMYCNFTGELEFTYTLTFYNSHPTNPRSAEVEFIIYNATNIELYRGFDTITNLVNMTATCARASKSYLE